MAEVKYVPDAMNQFYRLIRVSGPKGTGYYTAGDPWNNYVRNPTTGRIEDYDSRNCCATEGAVLWDAKSKGRERTSPVQIRNHQSDKIGGIGWDDVNEAYRDIFGSGSTLWTPSDWDWYDVINGLKQGRSVGVQVDYDQVPWVDQCQKGGTFDHAMSLHGYRSSDGRILRHDPLCRKMVWVTQRSVRLGAEKIALAQRGTKSRLFVIVTLPILVASALPSTGWRVSIQPIPPATKRRYWTYIMDRNETYIVDREATETRGWSARCTSPVRRRPVSTSVGKHGLEAKFYDLVKVVDPTSSYNKRWVAAGYADEV